MTKQDKIDIVNEALDVLYGEVNDFSIHSDFPEERLVHVVTSITRLESLLNLLECKAYPSMELLNNLKGE
jgi:hypothetical protein